MSNHGSIRHFRRPERDYTRVPNALITAAISATAYRVATYLLSHRDGFRVTNQKIADDVHLSLRTVVSTLAELERARYLVRAAVLAGGRRTGTDFLISGFPIPDGAETAPHVGAEAAPFDRAKTAPRKKTAFHKTNKTNLSEGDTAGAAPAEDAEEEPVKTKAKTQPVLFDVEAPPSPPREKNASDVAAAYAESYKQAHGMSALRSDIGRVASTAKALLGRAEATVEELIGCAQTMGAGTWSNLSQELKNSRSPRRAQTAPKNLPLLSDDPRWDPLADATRREEEALMEAHPDMWAEEVMA